ncbi:hypothetical protein SAMN04488577_0433 [Bacillus sp. cl95]|nr:hypothetical protein SAMN02799634_101148 [Bacillus sp. UNCCL13]SFQ60762.1 hypothetical protein SAMN04488577_0433 [Bacillus sp. cl95]
MYIHLMIALTSWLIAALLPTLSNSLYVSFMFFGLISFVLFIKDFLQSVNQRLTLQAYEAESKNRADLSSFSGTFIRINNEAPLFSKDFVQVVFYNGEMEVPLFCRNMDVVKKVLDLQSEVVVYYEGYLLIDVDYKDVSKSKAN